MHPVELTDGTVLLSVATPDDVDALTVACQDEDIAAWVSVPSPYRRADAEAFVVHAAGGWASGRSLNWAIRTPQGDLLGMVGLHGVGDGSAEIGFWVAPTARRRGVVSRAVTLVLDHAFAGDGLALARVTWLAQVGNWPSRRAAWRAGFRVEGTIRSELVQRGVRQDAWVATILRDDARGPAEPWPAQAPLDGAAVRGARMDS